MIDRLVLTGDDIAILMTAAGDFHMNLARHPNDRPGYDRLLDIADHLQKELLDFFRGTNGGELFTLEKQEPAKLPKPLTWDELRKRSGKPVYIDSEVMYAIVYLDRYHDEIYLNGIDRHGEPTQMWISRESDLLKHIYDEMI